MIGWVLTGLLLAFAAFIAPRDFRQGLLFCFWVVILQEPLRKIVPGQSVAMQILVLVALVFVSVVPSLLTSARRKVLVALVLFGGCYMAIFPAFWRGRDRLRMSSIVLAFGLGVAVWALFPKVAVSSSLRCGALVFAKGDERAGFAQYLASSAVGRGGFVGKGVAVFAHGVQFLGARGL